MVSSNAMAGRPVRRVMGVAGRRAETFALLAAGLVLLLAAPVRASARDDEDWVGKRVVPKNRAFVLLDDDGPVESSRKAIAIYRVERADGPRLWLQAEGQRLGGSARAEDVVPVERAVAFFGEQVKADPGSGFAHAMRALVRQDQKAYAEALRDYDQALGLDPRNVSLHRRRGDVRLALNDPDGAIIDYSEAIRLDPRSTLAYIGRGSARAMKKDFDQAVEDHSEAIWLDPLCIPAYFARGVDWQGQAENEKAIVDYNMVIRLDPENAGAYSRRARAWEAQKAYAKAVADFDLAIQLNSKEAITYERLAWIRATCPVERFRDGKKAVKAATRACELTVWKDASCLSTLAAAHAEQGDFVSAARWQTEANDHEANAEDRAKGVARLKLYREKKPYRDQEPRRPRM